MRSRAVKLAVAAACVLLVIAAGSERFLELDASIARWFRSHFGSAHTQAALLLTAIGSNYFALFILVLAGIPFAIKRWWADLVFLAMGVGGGIALDGSLKGLCNRPRPFSPEQTITFAGSSFPSGHAMTATILWGGLAMIILARVSRPPWRSAVAAAAVALVGLVATTRIYLGAHYLTDVVGGIAFGLLWLAICDAAVRAVVKRQSV